MLTDLLLKQNSPSLIPAHSSCICLQAFAVTIFPSCYRALPSSNLAPLSNYSARLRLKAHLHFSTQTTHQHGSLLPCGQPLTALTVWLSGKRHTVWRQRAWVWNQLCQFLAVWFLQISLAKLFLWLGTMYIKCLPWSMKHSRCSARSN